MDRFNAFTTLISSVSRNLSQIKTTEMKSFGLKGTHVSCLYYLHRADNCLKLKELCEIAGEDKAAISRSIEFLKRKEYIYADCSQKQKYHAKYGLTQTGNEIANIISERIDKLIEEVSDGINNTDRENFYKTLRKISENLEKTKAKNGGKNG